MCTVRCAASAGLAALAGLAHAQTIIVPNSLAAAEGGTSNSFPLSNTAQVHRYQQVYAAAEFAAMPNPSRITGLRLRGNGTSAFTPWSCTATLEIKLSATTAAPDALSTTFAGNVGAGETQVYNGSATYGTASSGPSPTLLPFDIEIMFQTPFPYDPASGNLLLDILKTSTNMATSRFADAHNVVGDSVSRLHSQTAGAATGTADSIGLVTQFLFEPIPAGCYANCDSSTAEPVLNVADFTCFLTKFAGGDPFANCDQSTAEPTLNVADFTCFLTKFAGGCP